MYESPELATSRNRRLAGDEEARLHIACATYGKPMPRGWLVTMAIATGMRAGALQTAHRDQVNLEKRRSRMTIPAPSLFSSLEKRSSWRRKP